MWICFDAKKFNHFTESPNKQINKDLHIEKDNLQMSRFILNVDKKSSNVGNPVKTWYILVEENFPPLSIRTVLFCSKGCWVVFFIFIQILIEHYASKQWRP